MSDTGLPDHVQKNRVVWDRLSSEYAGGGARAWAQKEPTWGIWSLPERELRVLPDVNGKDVIELGCGTAYWSAWLARRGARVVGIDNSEKQLETARALQREHQLDFPLIHGSAESVPLPDASFDVALLRVRSEPVVRSVPLGAGSGQAPAAGGDLVFLKNGTILTLCLREDDRPPPTISCAIPLGLHRLEWADTGTVEFALPMGEWIRLFRANRLRAARSSRASSARTEPRRGIRS